MKYTETQRKRVRYFVEIEFPNRFASAMPPTFCMAPLLGEGERLLLRDLRLCPAEGGGEREGMVSK